MKGLKVLLWETILVTLVIYCLQILLTHKELSLELLILPGAILLLAVALFFVRWKEQI
jgi:phosphate starvation-inducible membrane PsiE